MTTATFCCIWICLLIAAVFAANSPISISANVRGKRYEIKAATVEEVTSAVESLSGMEASEQSVLFRGKLLSPSDDLSEVGVSEGDTLNIVKGRRARARTADTASSPDQVVDTPFDDISANMSPEDIQKALKDMNPEEVKRAMEKFQDDMLDSDMMATLFEDEEKLEQARLDMLKNLDKFDMIPGLKEQARELASDPVKWREAMGSAREKMAELKRLRDSRKSGGGPSKAPDNSVSDFSEDDEE